MRILQEPLVHFLVLGAVVYVAAGRGESTRFDVDAGPEQRARLARTYFEQYGVAPTPSQLGRALDEYVRNEILYREGLAMGLERDDEIVRRRVVQKIEFVNEDVDAAVAPDGAGVARYFADHRDRYDSEPAVSFEHIFLSLDRGGDAVARRRAEAELGELAGPAGASGVYASQGDNASSAGAAPRAADSRRVADAPQGGDAFAEGRSFQSLTPTAANSLFGDTQLSAALFAGPVGAAAPAGAVAPTGQWLGPFRSAYGWHLVRITDRQPPHHAELEAVRARVQSDYLADVRERANTEAYRKIASKYRVVGVMGRGLAERAAPSTATAIPAPTATPTASATSVPTSVGRPRA